MRTLAIVVIALASLVFMAPAANVTNGTRTCPSSGNQPISTTSVRTATYTVQAPVTNTGNVCIGGLTVTTSNSICLPAGASYTAPTQGNSAGYDLSHVNMACTVSADVLKYISQ